MKSHFSKRILALLLTLAMVLTLLPTVFATGGENPFTDVTESDYYYEPVLWAVENGVTNGTGATTFSPGRTCTREQIVTFLWRASGEPEPTATSTPFSDVAAGAFYEKPVLWAVENKITNGVSADRFGVSSPCTRGQAVTFLWRAAGEPEPTTTECPFTDVAESDYYYDAVLWAVENGVTNGTGATTFSPARPCTRGQIVTFLYRAVSALADPKAELEEAVDEAESLVLDGYTAESVAALEAALAAAQAVLENPDATEEEIAAALAALQAAIDGLEEKPVSTDFVLSGELKDGDEVVIYNKGHNLAIKNETDNDWYIMGAEVTIDEENHKVVEPAADVIWTVGVGEDGTYTFTNGENMIVCWPSGNFFELTTDAGHADAVKEWKLKEADKNTYSYYIYNATLTGQYGNVWLEFYNKNGVDKLTGYCTSEDRLSMEHMGMQFYVKGAEYVEPGPGPGPGPEGDFVLSNDLSDGNEVVLYNAGNGMALTAEMSGYYVKGTAVTPTEDHKIANPAASIVWTIGSDEAGNLILRNGEKVLALTQSPKDGGGFYNNLSVEGGDYEGWTVVDCDTSNYSFYLYATGAQEQYGHVYLEWYGSKTAFSAYDTTNISAPNFGFQFYVKGAEWIDPGPGPGPIGENKVFVKVTEAPEDWSGTYVIARAKDETTAYVFDGTNDKNENFVTQPLNGDQITANTENAIVIEKSGDGYTFKANGGYLNGKGVDANGLVFETDPAVGSIAFADGLPTITAASGNIFRFNNKTYTDASYLWFRFFKPDSSVTTDANTYVELYKLDEGIEPPPPAVDKTWLKAAIDTAKALNPEKYTEESFAVVTAALEAAEAVYADPDATQEEVQTAMEALNDAIAQLEKLPVEGDFVLAVPENGDEVVIVNAASGLAIKNEPNDKEWYLLGGEVTVDEAEHKLAEPDEALVWTVTTDGNGMTRFTNGDNVITCWPSGSYFELTNNTAHDGSVTDWALVEADAATYSFYIKSWSLSGSYGPVWLEFYKASSSDPTLVCKAYSASEDKLNLENYGFQFYVKGAEYVEPGQTIDKSALQAAVDAAKALDPAQYTEESFAGIAEPLAAAEAILAKEDATQEEIDAALAALNAAIAALEKIPGEGEEYVLTNALKDGDKVIIYHPTSGMAVSNADLSASQPNYRAGVAVTPEDDKIIDPEDAIVWTVSEGGACFVFTDAEGHQLSCSGNNLKLDAEYSAWRIQEGGIEGTVNIINDGAPTGSSGDPRAMEWYAQYSEFSCYYLTATNDAFALQLFVKAEEGPEKDLEGKTVILHTNDTHGAIMGFANAASLKRDYEARGADVILVDAGDFSQGTTYVSSSKGAAAIDVMNAAGYDFVTLGNHEFDFGYAQLKENLEKAEFTVLCADVLSKENGASVFQTRTIIESNGLKIGLFGMETPETFTKVNPGLITEITFPQGEEMYLCAQNEVNWLKEEGADIIIGLVHLGVDDESAPNRSIDLYNHVEGIDFLIDGHSHTVMTEGPNGEPIQSTGTKADKTMFMNVGCIIIDPTAERKDGRITNELIPITAETPREPATAAVAQEIMDAVDAEYGQKFATSEVELNGDKAPGNRNMETNLGDLITDSMRWGVLKDMDAETLGVPEENVIAITNGGGIRAWIHAGDVTKNDVNTVLPFGNTVAVVYVTGAELLEALEASTYSTPGAVGGFPQVAGLKYTIDTSKDFDKGEQYPDSTYYAPASSARVTINGINCQAFDPAATYAVVTNNFCAAGGDTYYVFKNASAQFDTGLPMDEVLMEYIGTELGGVIGATYAEPQGRITILEDLHGKTVILHTNDTHGALLGFAQVAAVEAQLKEQGAEVITVDAGDFSQGTTYVSTNKGEAAVTVMNAAGYDVVTLGNHEFDFGYAQLMANLDKAEFDALCADVFVKASGESILPATVIKEIGGVKIGFFGMETPETQTKVNPGLITEIEFGTNENGKFLTSAVEAIDALKAGGADIIIGLVHLGVDAESEPYRSVDLYEKLEGVDFLIDGHSHTVMTAGPNGEPIQSTGTKASKTALMNVGAIVIDNETRKIEKNYLIPLGEDAAKDPAVAAIAQGIMDAVDAEYGQKFATSEVELNGDKAPGNRNMETNLGDLITDSMLWGVLKEGELEVPTENVVAITNGGGIRAWIHKGDVTKNDVNTVLPFGNTVAVVYVKGAELLEALEASTYSTPGAVGGFPQVSGMKFTIDTGKEFDQGEQYPESTYYAPASIKRVTIDEINGKPFDPEATYAVVTNNFCAAGGDTYYVFKNASAQFDTGLPLDEVLMEFITEELKGVIGETYAEPQGRITVLEPEKPLSIETTFPSATKADIDKYGDVHFSISSADLAAAGFEYKDLVTLKFLDYEIIVPIIPQYRYVGAKAIGLVMWEDGEKPAEVEIFNGSFAANFGLADVVRDGSEYTVTPKEGVEFPVPVTITMYEKQGYADTYAIFDLTRSNNREDYTGATEPYPNLTDEEFANFRAITTTGMGEGKLYRASSPINPSIGRNTYADKAAETAGVKSFVNLADSETSAAKYAGYEDSYYSKQNICFLNLGVDFTTELNREGLKTAMEFIANETSEAPFLVHCNEGQDRAGFVSALLECLMGATYDEVVADYMVTFYNYYGVQPGTDQYKQISNNIVKNLSTAFGLKPEALAGADLAAEAEEYLKELGVSDETIAAVRAKLGAESTELTMDEYLALDLYGWFPTGKTDYQVQAKMVSEDTEVYNFLEDVHYTAHNNDVDVVLKGTLGEEWVTKLSKVATTYTKLDGTEVTLEDFAVRDTYIDLKTIPTTGNFAYFIPAEYKVAVNTAWGDLLHANRDGVTHGDGDYLVCAVGEDGKPNLADVWVVNGAQFVKNYDMTYQIRRFEVVETSSNMSRFGHIDINISTEDFLALYPYGDILNAEVNGYAFEAPVCSNYDDVDTGEYLFRAASGKSVITLAINYGQIGVAAGLVEKVVDPETGNASYQIKEGVEFPLYAKVGLKEAGGYAEELAIRKLNRTNNREDYPELTDEEFANFRAVATTGMGEKVLYRSSSPVDPDLGRNTYADKAAEEAGVKTFINLADTQAEAEAFAGYAETYYSKQNVKFLGLPVAFTTDEFKAGLADGYRYITTNEAPYLIHCLEGKDRTGLSVAVLEALMGASLEEIQADYLKTYENYFDVKDGKQVALTDAQKEVLVGIITKNLGIIFDADLTTANLADEAEAYLAEIGLLEDEVITLKADLGGVVVPPEPEYVYYHGMGVADGDEVVIYHPDSGKAISNADSTVASNPERYRLGVDTTVENGIIAEPAEGTIWTVKVDAEKGVAFVDADGKYLSVPSNYGNLVLDSDCKYWTVSEAATEGCVYIISTESKGSSGDPRGIEYYQEKFTTYYASESNLASQQAAFALELYVKTDKSTIHEHDWVAGDVDAADCTHQEITHYTCSICSEEKTEVTGEALGHNWGDWVVDPAATCTTAGTQTHTCGRCAATESEAIPATGHKDENGDGKCDVCGEDMPASGSFVLFTGEIEEGDYLIVYKGKALKASQTANANRFDYADITEGDSIECDDALLIFHIAQSGDYWTIYNEEAGKYIGSNGTKNQGKLIDGGTDNSLWTVTMSDGKYEFVNKANAAAGVNSTLRNNGTYGWACYSSSTGGALTLYKLG